PRRRHPMRIICSTAARKGCATGPNSSAVSWSGRAGLRACVVAIAASVLFAGCHDVHGEAGPSARPVKIIEARPSAASSGIRYAVSIQPYQQIPLAFKVGGYIDGVLQRRGADGRMRPIQAGDAVRAGTALARVREADYRERINQADASLRELETALAKSTPDLDRARTLFAARSLVKPD